MALGHDTKSAGADDHDNAHDDECQDTDAEIAARLGQDSLGLKENAGTDDSAYHQCNGDRQVIPFFHNLLPFCFSRLLWIVRFFTSTCHIITQ